MWLQRYIEDVRILTTGHTMVKISIIRTMDVDTRNTEDGRTQR